MTRFRFWIAGPRHRFYIAVFKYPYSPALRLLVDRRARQWSCGSWLFEVGW
jgi:hypothetical protein